MASKVHVVKAKSAWKKVEIPTGGDFADLIELEELSDYELFGEHVSMHDECNVEVDLFALVGMFKMNV